MTILLQNMEGKVCCFFKRYGKYIFGGFLIGIFTYFMMISLNLVNDLDGIWHPSNFIAGDWEISLGRGLQRYADRIRFGIVSDPFNTMLTLLLVVAADVLVLMRFDFQNIVYRGLFLLILIANPVICNTLTYSYMSVNFGLAYFFSVAAFISITSNAGSRKEVLAGLAKGAVMLGISLAFYQAYVSVACTLAAMYIIKMLLERENTGKVLRYAGLCVGMLVMGGMVYLLVTKALLYRAGVGMAAYKGAADATLLSMVQNLPQSIGQCYLQFWKYFRESKAFSGLEFIDIVLGGLWVVYLAAAVLQFVRLFGYNRVNALLFAAAVLLLPAAGCFVLVLAVGNSLTGLMSMGVVMCTVMLGIVVPAEGRTGFWMTRIYLCFLAAFAWFQLSAVINDQLALKEGKTATVTLTQNIISRIYDEGYLDEYRVAAFVGRPGNNDGFVQSAAYRMANGYARFGCWSTDARNNRVSWNGVISNFLGVNLSLCGDSEYQELIASGQVADMPEFPAEGSVRIINNIIVVKVSELY